MKPILTPAILSAALLLGCAAQGHAEPPVSPVAAAARSAAPAVPAMADGSSGSSEAELALKTQAIDALKAGEISKTRSLIGQAASLDQDPAYKAILASLDRFAAQKKTLEVEKRKSFQEQVDKAHVLIDDGQDPFALSFVAEAYARADDKAKFEAEGWVQNLIARSLKQGTGYEQAEQWLKALRVYRNLRQLDPTNATWKQELTDTARRVRLLALYTPDKLKTIREADGKDLEAASKLLEAKFPTTKPATQPSTQPMADSTESPMRVPPVAPAAGTGAGPEAKTLDAVKGTVPNAPADASPAKPGAKPAATDPDKSDKADDEADIFRIDWKEAVEGVNIDMLREALRETEQNYYRPVDRDKLLAGGLDALRALATTGGLEATFPDLKDASRKKAFIDGLDELTKKAQDATARDATGGTLDQLAVLNGRSIRLPEEVLVSEFADGAYGTLDPFSTMIWPADVAEFNKSTQGEFSGVGISIRSEAGELLVVSPLEDSPAYDAGIAAGDVITGIDGKSAKGININQAVKKITGPTGTKVTLTVRHPDTTSTDYELTRQTIHVDSLRGWAHQPGGGWDYYVDPEQKIAYLRLSSFTKESGDEMAAEIKKLKADGARAIIFDLRNNPGGLLTAATEIADDFLPGGLIVETKTDKGVEQGPPIFATRSRSDIDVPVVVLVNPFSASASEIVSGTLKDLHRALIVGERSFGKGSVQMLFPLDRRQAYLKLTTSHYFLAGGEKIHREDDSKTWGVEPDVKIELTPEQMRETIKARQELDVLLRSKEGNAAGDAAAEKKLLDNDPQLSAALLLLHLDLAGTPQVAVAK